MPGLHGNGAGITDILFGDGSDGVVTISADTFLTQDMNYDTLTVLKGTRLFTNGFRVRCRNKLIIQGDRFDVGQILNPGLNARNSNGSIAEVSGVLGVIPFPTSGGLPGSTGGGGQGAQGMYNGGLNNGGNTLHDGGGNAGTLVPAAANASSPLYFLGGAGGRGGDAQAWVAGVLQTYTGMTGSSGTIPSTIIGGQHSFFGALLCGAIGLPNGPTGSFVPFAGGGGGGSGACGNSGSVGVRPRSGWGGGAGATVYVAARELQLLGKISVRGGSGGNSFSFGAGGGGGGGGFAMVVYGSLLLRNSLKDQIDVNGGLPGTGYTANGINPPSQGLSGSFFAYGV